MKKNHYGQIKGVCALLSAAGLAVAGHAIMTTADMNSENKVITADKQSDESPLIYDKISENLKMGKTTDGLNELDNKGIEETKVNYSSIKDMVVSLEDSCYGTFAGDLLGEVESSYFADEKAMYSDVTCYTAYASALMQGKEDKLTTDKSKIEGIKDKDISEEEVVAVLDCSLAQGEAYTVSEEEYDMLTRLVEAEAGGEDYIGQVLVANVVINRIRYWEFPSTIEGVIFEHNKGHYQFQPASGKINRVTPSSSVKKAVDAALSGDDYSDGALYFVSVRYANTGWFDSNLDHLFTHGDHAFYR